MNEADATTPLLLNDNGGWCWFQDERALIHGGKLWIGSVASNRGADGDTRAGNIEVTTHDFATGQTERFVLSERLEDDDHNVPALYVRPDGRVLAIYSKHSSDNFARWRITTQPGDVSAWEPEQTFRNGSDYCYNNVYALTQLGDQLFSFHRGLDRNPNYLVSDDHGSTWRYGGKLLSWVPDPNDPKATGRDGRRPYVRYASNDRDAIHFISTEDHPRGYDNSIYHGVARVIDGSLMVTHTDGRVIGPLADSPDAKIQPTDLTKVFAGDANRVGWTVDLRLDAEGHPVAVFSTQHGDGDVRDDTHAGGQDLRYHYARWDGTRWHEHEIAYAGQALYAPEVDYPGLAAIDPSDPATVYISTNADPESGEPLISAADNQRHYELFRGRTPDLGRTWEWKPITRDSEHDHLRPIVPPGDPDRAPLLWLAGRLYDFCNYDLRVMMHPSPREV
ncbi:MAG: BNR-4 repeat-containing protein [Planctomycetota bacterium]